MIIDVLFIKVDAFDSPGLINDLKNLIKIIFLLILIQKIIYVGKIILTLKVTILFQKCFCQILMQGCIIYSLNNFFIDYFNFFFNKKIFKKLY